MDTVEWKVIVRHPHTHSRQLSNIMHSSRRPNIAHVFIFLIIIPSALPQNYYYYPQEYFYQPQQQQFYYQQQHQQLPQQQQYFVQYYQPQQQFQQQFPQQPQFQQQFPQQQQFQQPFAQPQQPNPSVPEPQRQVYVEQQPRAQQFVQAPHQPPPLAQPIVVSMEATPPQKRLPEPAVLPQKQMSIYDETSRTGGEEPVEFDLPPPPPAQFLPDESEKIKIAQLLAAQYKAEQEQQRLLQQQQNNRQLVTQRRVLQQQRQIELQQQQQHQQIILQQQQQQHHFQEQQRLQQEQQLIQAQQEQQQRLIQQQQQRRNELTTRQPAASPLPIEAISSPPVSHLSPTKSAEPNKVFLTCCKKKRVIKSCESRCNFDNLNKKILTQMFLGTDPCPQSHGLDLFACAAQESDHRQCCKERRVHRTAAGEKCLDFCNLTPNSQFQADASYLPCWAVLNDVKGCFKDAILSGRVMP